MIKIPRVSYDVSTMYPKVLEHLVAQVTMEKIRRRTQSIENFDRFFSKNFPFDDLAPPELAWGVMIKTPRVSHDVCSMYPKVLEHLVAQGTMDKIRRRMFA